MSKASTEVTMETSRFIVQKRFHTSNSWVIHTSNSLIRNAHCKSNRADFDDFGKAQECMRKLAAYELDNTVFDKVRIRIVDVSYVLETSL